jgi:branched-chain amino acid transport system substrate-binding protein
MKTGPIITILIVALIAFFLYSQYQRGRVSLPGLPSVPATTAQPTSPQPIASSPPSASTTPPANPTGTIPPPTDPASTLLGALSSEPIRIVLLVRDGKNAEAVAAADAWLAKNPTDAVVALERQNAVTGLVTRPTVTIGLSAPLSGPLKQVGQAFAQGVNLAVTEANSAGGVKTKRVIVEIVNDGGNRTQAIDAASKLFKSKAVGVVGPYSSSTTLASAEIYNQGLAIIAPAATNPRVSQAGPYIYRVAPSDAQQGASLARLVKARGHKQVAVLSDPNDAYSKGLADAFVTEAEKIGLTTQAITFDLNGYTNPKVGNFAVDAIFVSGYTADVAAVARLEVLQKREIFGGDGAYGQDLLQQGGKFVEGVVMTTFWHSTLTDAASKTFRQRFEARYGGGTPNANAMQAYDATRTLLEAIRRAPNPTREGIKAGLETFRTRPGPGITAPVKFDANGDVVGRPWVAITVKDGAFQAIGLAP